MPVSNKNLIDFRITNEIFALLASILAKGLTDKQRDEVIGNGELREYLRNARTDLNIFEGLVSYYKSTNSLVFVLDIFRRIQATQSFYRNVGPELNELSYLIDQYDIRKVSTKHESPKVFVLLPFREENIATYEISIKKSLVSIGCSVEYADEANTVEPIVDTIFKKIAEADFLVADTTGKNPNVFYEIGYAHALGKKVILLVQDTKEIPFNLSGFPHIKYSPDARNALSEKLKKVAMMLLEELGN